MRELSVSTQTTPVELAELFNRLSPNDEIGGKPGVDGAVVLYICGNARLASQAARLRTAIAARVAIDVVLQHVEGMPGAQPLVGNVREQLDGPGFAQAGWLAPPMTMLARLYCKTVDAMPGGIERIRSLPQAAMAEPDDGDVEEQGLTPEQRQALDKLIDRLMQLPCSTRQPDRR